MSTERHLEILLGLLNRCPMNEAEALGANACAESIRKALVELKELKGKPVLEPGK